MIRVGGLSDPCYKESVSRWKLQINQLNYNAILEQATSSIKRKSRDSCCSQVQTTSIPYAPQVLQCL